MSDQMEIILELKIAQLEGKLLLYESLIKELVKIENIQQIASDVKNKLEKIVSVWNQHKPLDSIDE